MRNGVSSVILWGIGCCIFFSPAHARPDDKARFYSRQMDAYLDCNIRAAQYVARQQGDPVSLGLAARGMCGKEDATLTEAVIKVYQGPMALRVMRLYREKTLETNAGAIVMARGKRLSR